MTLRRNGVWSIAIPLFPSAGDEPDDNTADTALLYIESIGSLNVPALV